MKIYFQFLFKFLLNIGKALEQHRIELAALSIQNHLNGLLMTERLFVAAFPVPDFCFPVSLRIPAAIGSLLHPQSSPAANSALKIFLLGIFFAMILSYSHYPARFHSVHPKGFLLHSPAREHIFMYSTSETRRGENSKISLSAICLFIVGSNRGFSLFLKTDGKQGEIIQKASLQNSST